MESEYELRMLAVFNHVLEEVENLTRKHPPVSYLVCFKVFIGRLFLSVIQLESLFIGTFCLSFFHYLFKCVFFSFSSTLAVCVMLL